MKKGRYIFRGLSVIILSGLLFAACKKTTTQITTTTSDSSKQGTIATDELNVNNEVDQAIDEAVSGLCECKTTSGNATTIPYTLLNAVIDTSQVDSGIVSIDYFGKEANPSKSRSGTVQIKLPVVSKHVIPWNTAGVTATITLTSYEIFYLNLTNITLWFKGTYTVTNYNGRILKNLAPSDSLMEKVRGSVSYTYNDNGPILQLNACNLHRTRVLRTDTNVVSVITRGDTAVNGYNNVSAWGQTRFVQPFYTSITTPIFQEITTSNYYNPLRGVKSIQGIPEPIVVTLGVNQQGTPVATGTPYGYLITWTNSSGPQSLVISY